MRRLPTLVPFLTLALLSLAPAAASLAQEPEPQAQDSVLKELPVVPETLRVAMLHGRHEDARRILKDFLASEPELADLWLYLDALVQERSGALRPALDGYRRVEAEHPASPWATKARFHRADLHGRLGEWADAERIWEQAARDLRSEGRQGELARIYLDIADELSTAAADAQPGDRTLDYPRAAAIYTKVLELEAPAADREEARYRYAWCVEQGGDWNRTAQAYALYLEEFEPGGKRVFEARFRRGNALMLSGNKAEARRVFEDLSAALSQAFAGAGAHAPLFAGADAAQRTAWRELAGDADFARAHTFVEDDLESRRAISALDAFLTVHPDHPRTPDAAFEKAGRAFRRGWDEEAVSAFDAFLARDPRATEVVEDREREARLRQSGLYSKGQVLHRQGRFEQAIAVYLDYTGRYPNGPDWAAAQQGMVDAEYQIGTSLRERGEWQPARDAWNRFLAGHPLDHRALQTMYSLGELHAEEAAELAKDSPQRQASFHAAIAEWRKLLEKYPTSAEASMAIYRTGELFETELLDLEQAIQSYRKCDFGPMAGEARMKLVVMTRPHLAVRTPRSWRSDEAAALTLDTRNVDSVLVQVYPLDLEAYFRKHLTHTRVEDLDLDLIAPEMEFQLPVEGAADYLPLENQVVLPVEGPGVWAVAVSAGKLRATTLVVRSDVDVILKSSRREVFAYAQDMRLQEPAAGVSVLLALPGADGAPEFHELTTGADGVARLRLERLRDVDWLRMFAARDGHCASNGLSLGGLDLARGLSARGLVYTDRPAYRPGTEVSWRAVLRHVEAGSYAVREGSPVSWRVIDAQGRVLRLGEASLSSFGTVHGAFELPEHAAVGDYRLECQAAEDLLVQGRFTVAEYQLPKVQLSARPESPVIYRGEDAVIAFEAAWAYGEPVAGALLEVSLPDGRRESLRTDDDGRAELRFPTRDMAEERGLSFHAVLPEEGAAAQAQVWLATRGFSAAVSLRRDVVLAGESFPVTVTTTAASGEPVGRDLRLEVLLRKSERGRWSETRVQSHALKTAEGDGAGSLNLAVADGGSYLLRAFGEDRFGNTIVAEQAVFVSGKDDDVKLRLLVDDAELEVGETLRAALHNRAGAGLALLTFEGEEILGYRIVRLGAGTNTLALDIGHDHFPNFSVSAAMMRGDEFFQARAEFRVSRELRVAIEPEREVYAPGELAYVGIHVTDQLGRPVSAEVSLGVVDDTLYDLFADPTPALRPFFEQGTWREAALRTETSCTFRYAGVTREIASAVIEEAERLVEQYLMETELAAGLEELSKAARRGKTYRGPGDIPLPEGGGGRPSAPGTPPTPGLAGQLRQLGYVADEPFSDSAIGMGGGAGGRFGGRGGNKRLSAGEPLGSPAETAFWAPAVVTDADGRARVRFEVPAISTRWRLTARGVGDGTLLGEQRVEVISRADFFVELRTPAALVEGDRPRFLARVHNLTGLEGSASLKLRIGEGDAMVVMPAQVELAASSVAEVVFPATGPLPASGELRVALEGTAVYDAGSELRDGVARSLKVRPWGIEVADAASGMLSDRLLIELELPATAARLGRLELFVGHGIGRLLIDEALGGAGPMRRSGWTGGRPSTLADFASQLLGVAAVLEQLERGGRGGVAEYAQLRARAESLAAALIAAQRADGGWSWAEGSSGSSPETSCDAMLALARARRAGVVVPAKSLDDGLAYLDGAFRAVRQQALELKAMLVHAKAAHGRHDFAAANALHRERGGMSPAALAHTALALVAMDRKPMAAETAGLLAAKLGAGHGRCPVDGNLAWNRSPLEMTALALMALQASLPDGDAANLAAEFLLSHRPWSPARARGWAVAALAEREASVVPSAERLELSVKIGDSEPQLFELGAETSGVRLDHALAAGATRVKVELSVRGRGRPHYAAVLRGFTDELGERKENRFRVTRHDFLAATPRYRGHELPTGFAVLLDSGDRWTNQLTELPLGGLARVAVEFYRSYTSGEPVEERDFLVLEVPLPAGARVLDGSVSGGFQSWEQRDGVLVVQVGPHAGSGHLQFELVGALPGDYRVLPVALRSAYEPELLALSKPKELRVLERGAVSTDDYRPTPDELFRLGLSRYENGEAEGAWEALSALYSGFGDRLREDRLREAATALLYLAVDRGESSSIVRYFEVLKEKDPELTVSFDRVLAVGEAYRELEEFERALLIFRAVVEETFGKDLKVAGALEENLQTAEAFAVLERLGGEYPDLPIVVEAALTLSDQLLTAAPGARQNASLKRAGLGRTQLSLRGIGVLRLFLALHADDPLAADAGLNLVSAYLGLEDFETSSALAGELAGRFTKPEYADAFLYTRAVAEWYLGREEEAVRLLERIAAAEYPAGRDGVRPSPNRDLALFILGQIYHARRDVARAADYYARVEEQFRDARETLLDFREKRISLPEVTTARPGGKVGLEVEFRNVKQADLLVYSVDLMTLYLREKDLSRVTEVNLAGIEPKLRQTVELGGGGDLLPRKHLLELALKEPGAYLVICRGDELHASGLVLVSELDLRVKEDPVAGSLRVQALAREDQRFLRDVDVRVVGSASGEFRSGKTDPRGIYVADGVSGTSTVIAKMEGGHYAFFRGETLLAMAEGRRQEIQSDSRSREESDFGQQGVDGVYFQNVLELNSDNQVQRQARYKAAVQADRKGVQVKQVK